MYSKGKKIKWKQWVLILSVLLLLVCIAGGAYAYLTARTDKITNRFDPVQVTCQVEERFEDNVKRDVCVRNTGDIDAFIRTTVVVCWVDSNGKVLANAPVEGVDYTVEWGNEWSKGSDGFWYYKSVVTPNSTTADLIETLQPVSAGAGKLQVQIFATAIQAAPAKAAENAWGVSVDGNVLIPA